MDVLGVGGQPMDVIFSISVPQIDELEITSKKVDVIKGGMGGSKNNFHWTLSVAVIYI